MKRKKLVGLVLVFAMVITLFAGCSEKEDKPADNTTDAAKPTISSELTVTFYDSDGTTVLKTEKVAQGGTIASYQPEKEGFSFLGWFATPKMSHAFDFTAPITSDTSIFAGFSQAAADNRSFAIVGSGTSPILLASNWGKTMNEEHKLVKNPDKNEYTISLDLYEGDEFQFVINSEWQHQRGYGYMTTIEQDGKEYFANSGGLGDTSVKRSNIKVAVTGNYTITLTTNPADDVYETDNAAYTEENKEAFNISPYDTITWVYNGEPKEPIADLATNYYIKGAGITDWKDKYTSQTGFTEENGIHTLVIALKEGEEFMFTSTVTAGDHISTGTEYIRFNNISEENTETLALFDKTDSYNFVAKANGLYTFTYDPAAAALTAVCDTSKFLESYDYFVKGSFGGTEWGTEGNSDYQLIETESGSFLYTLPELVLEASDELGVQSMAGSDRVLFLNYLNMGAASEDNANGNFEPHSNGHNNIVVKTAGTYAVTFNAYTNELSFTLVK